ncbi:MAG: DUF2029 domain-containing protein [Candidatus Omnitrophica bacterium]|nr:DUF2029 domain-containing protein [Candidatus Omnitrophota bacterium]
MPKTRVRKAIYLLVACVIISGLCVSHMSRAKKRGYSDFHCYYVAGERMLKHENIYVAFDKSAAEFRYAPIFALAMSPFALLKERYADLAWYILNLVLSVASFILAKKMFARYKLNRKKYFLLNLLVFVGGVRFFLHNLDSGQSNILMMFSLLFGLYCMQVKKEAAAGMLLAFSMLIKFTPLVFIPYFILRRKGRLVLMVVFFLLIYLLLPSLFIGEQLNMVYLNNLLPHLSGSTILEKSTILDPKNQSLLSFIYRIFTNCRLEFHAPYMPFQSLGLNAGKINLIFLTACFILYILPLYKKGKDDSVDLAMLIASAALFNLNAWMHNYILLLPAYFLIIGYLLDNDFGDKTASIFLILSYLLAVFNAEAILGEPIQNKLDFYSPFTLSALSAYFALVKIKFIPRP